MLVAREEIGKEPHKIAFFFGFPLNVGREYIRKQLLESGMPQTKFEPAYTTDHGSHGHWEVLQPMTTETKCEGNKVPRRASKRITTSRDHGMLSSSMFNRNLGHGSLESANIMQL